MRSVGAQGGGPTEREVARGPVDEQDLEQLLVGRAGLDALRVEAERLARALADKVLVALLLKVEGDLCEGGCGAATEGEVGGGERAGESRDGREGSGTQRDAQGGQHAGRGSLPSRGRVSRRSGLGSASGHEGRTVGRAVVGERLEGLDGGRRLVAEVAHEQGHVGKVVLDRALGRGRRAGCCWCGYGHAELVGGCGSGEADSGAGLRTARPRVGTARALTKTRGSSDAKARDGSRQLDRRSEGTSHTLRTITSPSVPRLSRTPPPP